MAWLKMEDNLEALGSRGLTFSHSKIGLENWADYEHFV
jgi:hypothetical protein